MCVFARTAAAYVSRLTWFLAAGGLRCVLRGRPAPSQAGSASAHRRGENARRPFRPLSNLIIRAGIHPEQGQLVSIFGGASTAVVTGMSGRVLPCGAYRDRPHRRIGTAAAMGPNSIAHHKWAPRNFIVVTRR